MKLIFVTSTLTSGGAERVGVALANGFSDKGHEVVVVSDLFEEQTYTLNASIILKSLVPNTNSKILKWGKAIFLLRRILKREKPNVIIGIMPLCSFVAKLASIGLNIPLIATEHDSFERPESAPMSNKEYLSKFWLNRIYRVVTVLTEADKKVIGNRLKNIVVMPNPLFLEPIFSTKDSLDTMKEKMISLHKQKIVLAAGRVDAWHYKGFDLLIKAWGKVMQNSKLCLEWQLQIAGVWRNENSKKFLEGLAENAGCSDNVKFIGFHNNMQPIYQQSSIFVLSSRYEGFGLVLIEAMSQGCACVAADYKGRQSEIIRNSKEGKTCDVDNVDALAKAICKMMKDEKYRKQVQMEAVKRSCYYSISQSVERWERLINSVGQH